MSSAKGQRSIIRIRTTSGLTRRRGRRRTSRSSGRSPCKCKKKSSFQPSLSKSTETGDGRGLHPREGAARTLCSALRGRCDLCCAPTAAQWPAARPRAPYAARCIVGAYVCRRGTGPSHRSRCVSQDIFQEMEGAFARCTVRIPVHKLHRGFSAGSVVPARPSQRGEAMGVEEANPR